MTCIFDEYELRKLNHRERIDHCKDILRNEKDDSLRWDAVWIAGEILDSKGKNGPFFDEVSDLMGWVLRNDDSGMVKHEACYQIAVRKMYKKIPDLLNSALNDSNGLVTHEAVEALGLLNALDSEKLITKCLNSSNPDIRQTIEFVLRRKERQQKNYLLKLMIKNLKDFRKKEIGFKQIMENIEYFNEHTNQTLG